MASQTPNIGLTLPIGTEKVSRQIINTNNTTIDTEFGLLNGQITNKEITLASINNDLNNAIDPGIVTFNGSQAPSINNTPVAKGGFVIVFKCKDNEIIQEYITRRTEGIQNVFVRIKAGSTWSPWEELALNSKYTTENKTLTGSSVSANSVKDFDIDVTKSGYKAIGIIGTLINSGGACCLVSSYVGTSTSARVRVRNTGSSAVTPDSIEVKVLYEKT